MNLRYVGRLGQQQLDELAAKLGGRKITSIHYDFQDGYSYIEFKLEDDTRFTVYYPLEEGGLTVTEGFP
ncbi:MAG: hypothetical protein QW767_01710 [Thermoprotei archaeon]